MGYRRVVRRFLVILLAACSHAPSGPPVELIASTAPAWIEVITHAKHDLAIEASRLSDPAVVDALVAFVKSNGTLRLLVEKSRMGADTDQLARLMQLKVRVVSLDLGTLEGTLDASYAIGDDDAVLGGFDAELGARVRDGAVLAQLRAVFETDWAFASGEPAPQAAAPTGAIRLDASPQVHQPPGVPLEQTDLADMIAAAQGQLSIALPGGYPDLGAPIAAAAARGVKIRMILATRPDEPVSGVEIRVGVVHASLLVAGTHAWLGSGEWTPDARTIGLAIDDPKIAQLFEAKWRAATP